MGFERLLPNAIRLKMEADSSAELLAHQGNYQGAAKVKMLEMCLMLCTNDCFQL